MKNIVLIAPNYMNYDHVIEQSLIELGFNVWKISDRPNANTIKKILTRITPMLNDFFYFREFYQFFMSIDEPIDVIFVVNGEGLSKKILKYIAKMYGSSFKVFYTWDSFKNKAQNYSIFDGFDRLSTFDLKDAHASGWRYEPLFFVSQEKIKDINFNGDVCFVGSYQYHRFKTLVKIKKINKIKSDLTLVCQSWLVYVYYLIKNIRNIGDYLSIVTLKKVNFKEVIVRYASSRAVLDLHSPSQSGLTIRVFETLSVGQKLITTSEIIDKHEFYNPKHIFVIDKNTEFDS